MKPQNKRNLPPHEKTENDETKKTDIKKCLYIKIKIKNQLTAIIVSDA